ncbi:unnamed protein product [Peronospora belbahrii]|uniref:WRKY19-like zinc finger domain-containing protein n=3 Tax=Peronospora belbahrii TaxID=622444 RepID=A0AAU9LDB7_9STRA|nr:unnamed protein product [Peronospora belbahrii]CAH0478081.1 unnamed protein product [Peronospora belbahrii]CAH0516685.1 unnamed protein product [Peronospora belbahrii]
METTLTHLNLELSSGMWKQPSSHATDSLTDESHCAGLCSHFPRKESPTPTSSTSNTEWLPRIMGMSDVLRSHVSPLTAKSFTRLPSIGVMINRDASPMSLIPVQTPAMHVNKQRQDTKMTSLRHPELKPSNVLANVAVRGLTEQQICKVWPALNRSTSSDKSKRTSNAKLCGMAKCNKRTKAGGFCIAHGGGLRCSKAGCTKHAVSLGLCISHGGGKRCTMKGCLNASRKNGVCWTHGGKRMCKIEGCNKGPKSGGYCWSHGGKMRK